MILLIDNYDSFSYNLYQMLGEVNSDIMVVRNDQITLEQMEALQPEALIISPGPGRPQDAGICIKAIQYFANKIPILGVCLGHQAICEAFGATVSYAKTLMHGKTSLVEVSTDCVLFQGLSKEVTVARYHSLAALPETMPETLVVTAITKEGEIMAVKHRDYPVYGVQFHPESVLTPDGSIMLRNFIGGYHD